MKSAPALAVVQNRVRLANISQKRRYSYGAESSCRRMGGSSTGRALETIALTAHARTFAWPHPALRFLSRPDLRFNPVSMPLVQQDQRPAGQPLRSLAFFDSRHLKSPAHLPIVLRGKGLSAGQSIQGLVALLFGSSSQPHVLRDMGDRRQWASAPVELPL